MAAKIYYDNDADLSLLSGKTIAVLGYGSQGHAQAQNLRESGCRVIVAELPGTPGHERAVRDRFRPLSAAEATRQGDVIALLLPDEQQADVFHNEIRANLAPGNVLVAAHGFNLYFGRIALPEGVAAVLVAPNGPGSLVRSEYLLGRGVPCAIAAGETARAAGVFSLALAYAKAIGCTRAGAIESTLEEETVADLFGEQVVLCGGMGALVKAAFETLVEAGYQAEMAYLVCVHELKQIVDLVYQGGLGQMRQMISNTAEYGDYTRGPRIITPKTKAEMKRILAEIRDGRFAREWLAESRAGGPEFHAMRGQQQSHPIEEAGRRVRKLVPWLDPDR